MNFLVQLSPEPDNTVPCTANDGMKYNFNALSQFTSVRNSNASSIMRQLGFHTDSTYLNLRYPGNTILMDSILLSSIISVRPNLQNLVFHLLPTALVH